MDFLGYASNKKTGPLDVVNVQGPLAETRRKRTESQLKKTVDERPEGAKFRAVSWENPEEVQRWLTAVKEEVDDLSAAARDRMLKKRDRVLSRHEAQRQATEAIQSLDRLFAAAKPPEPREPQEGEAG